MKTWRAHHHDREAVLTGGVGRSLPFGRRSGTESWHPGKALGIITALAAGLFAHLLQAQGVTPGAAARGQTVPPRVAQAQRFLAQRGWGAAAAGGRQSRVGSAALRARPQTTGSAATAAWQPLGPTAVTSANYGLVTGRVASIALDPSDASGNQVYIGTTGGGVWMSQNAGASNASGVVFTPLTDRPAALSGAHDASISVGAVTVQAGGTGVILAGTGDPNDALDSYYGTGILRSTDGGKTWSLIQLTSDLEAGLGIADYTFIGEGFAGFAWSTADSQRVVAAVSEAYEGTLADAERPSESYAGLYYSADSGATWHLARITDPSGVDVQGPLDAFVSPNGNSATSVVWNPVRGLFVAAVRYHGYYQSPDGVTWTRLAAQPGTGLAITSTSDPCPTVPGQIGSVACPIFRGTLAVNPLTGDTFAWTVDANLQDQGVWQDVCAMGAGACANPNLAFGTQWSTAALETNTLLGAATIANGDYNLALAAVPAGQDTLLLAGANDLWKCSLAMGCAWRNTTNASTCMSAQVAGYQHALAWNAANPQEIFVGNDSGLWRSTDAIGESGAVCSVDDATHFENLNAGLGSLAEVESVAQGATSPYTMMAGLGVNGTAGVKSATGPTVDWPQILGGEGGPAAIDPGNPSNWYVNDAAGVSIHLCAQTGGCTPAAFGATAAVTDADVSGDGYTMTAPATFLIDPLDASQLLVGTCRVWRGPATGGWSGANAISLMLDGVTGNSACSGDALIRTMAALALPGGGEAIYAGMYGALDGGGIKAGRVFRATFVPGSSTLPVWQDLGLNPVTNDSQGFNSYGLDISSIFVDPHDATGNTVYVTVEGVPNPLQSIRMAYSSTDGGAHWAYITSNLPLSAANSLVVDPQDANTAYIATDEGVYSTRQIATCGAPASNCWSAYGSGLPEAPVVQLSAAPASSSPSVLVAATYGRGIWQLPLWTAGTQLTTATATPGSLSFGSQDLGSTSSAQAVTLTNTGGVALTPTAIAASGDFSETDNCVNASLSLGASCTIEVTFTPTQTGTRTGQLTIGANVAGGQLTASLSGTGLSAAVLQVTPAALDFGQVETGTTSSAQQVTVGNGGAAAIAITSTTVTAPFVLTSNACGSSLAANSACQMTVSFAPVQTGAATGTLTLVDGAGTQTVTLSGSGAAPPTDGLSPASLTFPGTVMGALSPAQTVTLANSGGVALTGISAAASGPFQVTSNCGTQLAGGTSCGISVVFAPTAAGTQTGTLTVSDALRQQTVPLSGSGLQPPAIGVSPASLTFAAQQVGVAGAALVLTVSNTGGAPMANVGFQIAGPSASSFATGTTTCGATLSNGGSCTVQVIFTPAATGGNAATLTVSSSTAGVNAGSVALSGTGIAASGLNVSPAQMSFSELTLGQASAAQTATITNSSGIAADGLTLTATAPFSLTGSTCSATLAAGGSCTAGVVFTPAGNGTVAGTLTVSASALNAATVMLSGAGGQAGSVQLAPAVLVFAATGVGTASGAQTVTVTNSGAMALTSLTLSVSSGFELGTNTCATTLAAGASCTVGVAFAPSAAGPQSGNLTVTATELAQAAQAALSGMGFDFTASLSGAPAQTVASGQTASFQVALTPMSGSTGTFTFQCGALPANAVCVFNPASATVAANTTGSEMVEVETGHSLTASVRRGQAGWGALPIACGLLLLPLAWGRRRRALLLAAVLAILAGGVSSCSGSGGGTGGTPPGGAGNGSTPPGTYSIPVTVAANGVTHAVTLQVTVD